MFELTKEIQTYKYKIALILLSPPIQKKKNCLQWFFFSFFFEKKNCLQCWLVDLYSHKSHMRL